MGAGAVDINAHADRVEHGETGRRIRFSYEEIGWGGNVVGPQARRPSPNFRAAGLGAMCLESPRASTDSLSPPRPYPPSLSLICHLQSRAHRATIPAGLSSTLFLFSPSYIYLSLSLFFVFRLSFFLRRESNRFGVSAFQRILVLPTSLDSFLPFFLPRERKSAKLDLIPCETTKRFGIRNSALV